ncbi:hypothetical protein VN1000_15590 [Helicobacter pylori]
MALEKSYSKNFESDELFDYEIIKPKKTLKIQYTYFDLSFLLVCFCFLRF